jgi:HlyD family secretion protein
MKKRRAIRMLTLAVVGAAALGFAFIQKAKPARVNYQFDVLTRGDIESMVVTSGTINPIVMVDVGSQVSGRIEKLYVDFNSLVKKGQIIAQLDMKPLKLQAEQNEANYKSEVAALDRAKATLDQLKKRYDRDLILFEKKLLSPQDKDAAEASYLGGRADVTAAEAGLTRARAQLDQSRVNLDYAIIRSPTDGIVINREVSEGQTLQASFSAPVLYQIATDLTKMKVACSVDEADISKVKEGQIASFTVQAFPDETFNGTVQQVQFENQTTSNVVTYTTIVTVDNPEIKLRPGMTATVSIKTGEIHGILMVPNSALRFMPLQLPVETSHQVAEMRRRPGNGNGIVWIMDDQGRLKPCFVQTGLSDKTYSECLAGDLKEGQKVVVGKVSAVSTIDNFLPPPPPMGGPPPPPPGIR